jgi:hypothetical protein
MKKIAPIAVLALFVAFTSCKKKYTCECTIAGTTTKAESGKVKKSEAKTWCDNADASAKTVGGSCKLD